MGVSLMMKLIGIGYTERVYKTIATEADENQTAQK
jgi:hypothetical protein